MKPINVLHMADLHFDSSPGYLGAEKSNQRKTEILISFKKCIERFCEADIVLIAGDLFDGLYNELTVKYLCKLINAYPEKHFFVSAGNHDNLSTDIMNYFKTIKPHNLHIFSDTIECVHIGKFDADIYGASFSMSKSYTSLLNGFRVDNSDMVNIMLMHGEISAEGDYNPIALDEIKHSGLDYLALGHVHSYSGVNEIGGTYYAYPGVFEPRGFDECGKCGVLYGQISKSGVKMNFYKTAEREYHRIEIDISDCCNDAEVVNIISDITEQSDIYKIILTGARNPHYVPNLHIISEMINVFWCEVADSTRSHVSVLDYSDENSLRGYVAKELRERLNNRSCTADEYKKASEILTYYLIGGDDIDY